MRVAKAISKPAPEHGPQTAGHGTNLSHLACGKLAMWPDNGLPLPVCAAILQAKGDWPECWQRPHAHLAQVPAVNLTGCRTQERALRAAPNVFLQATTAPSAASKTTPRARRFAKRGAPGPGRNSPPR